MWQAEASATTKQPWLWERPQLFSVIPSGKPSSSFNYPGFSKLLLKGSLPGWVSCGGDTLLEKGGFGGCGPEWGFEGEMSLLFTSNWPTKSRFLGSFLTTKGFRLR